MADDVSGLRVVDVSDPASPTEVGFCVTPSSAFGIAVAGNYAFVAAGVAGLRIIDVTNPTAPVEVGFYDTPDYAEGVALSGADYAFVADGYAGLHVINVTNSAAPQRVGYYNTPGYAQGVGAAGSYAYVADAYNLGVYDWSAAVGVEPGSRSQPPVSFALLPAHPNPFNFSTVLSFELPIACSARLEVFDINGQHVGVGFIPAGYDAGIHRIPFDGSGLTSGVYLARLTAGDWSAVQKLVLLK